MQLNIPVNLPLDDNGLLGRECLNCLGYFKIKPGTGLDTEMIHCPYCGHYDHSDNFWTDAQNEYVESIALREAYQKFINPLIDKLVSSFKELERTSRKGLITFKVSTSDSKIDFPIKYYVEDDLETSVQCENCNLVFAIYGVYSRCPDCSKINAFQTYSKSLELLTKKLSIFSKPEIPPDLKDLGFNSVLVNAISVFDGLGKELRNRKPHLYPKQPNNLFQNLKALNDHLNDLIKTKHSNYELMFELFQVRHLIEHSMSVIDTKFIDNVPRYTKLLGRKYTLTLENTTHFVSYMEELGAIIKNHFEAN